MINWNDIYIHRLNELLNKLDENIENINNLYKQYEMWNLEFFNKYKNNKGESIKEIILNHIHKNIQIK